MPTDPTNGAGYDETGAPYVWVLSPDHDREVARVAELPRLVLLGYVREDGIPMPAPAPGSLAAIQAALATLPATYASKPTNAGTTGQAIVKQADGTLAFASVGGGGGSGIAYDTDGVPYLTS